MRIVGSAVVLSLACALIVPGVARAQAVTRLVATTGADVGDCSVSPCATIQFAVGVAAPGDTILVSPGTYAGSIGISTDNITLRGSGAATTTIAGSSIGYGSVIAASGTPFTIEGFTISGLGPTVIGIALGANQRGGAGYWTVRGNIITGSGEGIQLGEARGGGLALIENNLIVGNASHGIRNDFQPIVTIRNNTIAGNGWAGYHEQLGIVRGTIVNNIVVGNGLNAGTICPPCTQATGIRVGGSSVYDISFNNVFGNAFGEYTRYVGGTVGQPYVPSPGTGELSVDPLFQDPASGDYRLTPGSPSIDAGTNSNATSRDLDGHTRPLDGDGDGTAVVDMGAFEAPAPTDTTAPRIFAEVTPSIVSSIGHRSLTFVVVGSVRDEGGVDPASGVFTVTDEYGTVEPHGTFTIGSDGRYTFVVSLEAWRRGDDRDGRRYLITVTADDVGGNTGVTSTRVVVRHDMRPESR